MRDVKDAAAAFLRNKRIAVTGVSREPASHGGNVVYKRLRDRGYEVFAVNPNADEVEGDRSYHSLREIPGGVDAVVIATKPDAVEGTMRECAELGVKHAWMHRAFGEGSVCNDATVYGREHGITVIDGGCPLMFDPVSDPGHKIMRFVLTRRGKVPRAARGSAAGTRARVGFGAEGPNGPAPMTAAPSPWATCVKQGRVRSPW